jgi:hypothetical protein
MSWLGRSPRRSSAASSRPQGTSVREIACHVAWASPARAHRLAVLMLQVISRSSNCAMPGRYAPGPRPSSTSSERSRSWPSSLRSFGPGSRHGLRARESAASAPDEPFERGDEPRDFLDGSLPDDDVLIHVHAVVDYLVAHSDDSAPRDLRMRFVELARDSPLLARSDARSILGRPFVKGRVAVTPRIRVGGHTGFIRLRERRQRVCAVVLTTSSPTTLVIAMRSPLAVPRSTSMLSPIWTSWRAYSELEGRAGALFDRRRFRRTHLRGTPRR